MMETFKLDTARGRKALQAHCEGPDAMPHGDEYGLGRYLETGVLDRYLETGVPPATHNGNVVVTDTDGELLYIRGGLIHVVTEFIGGGFAGLAVSDRETINRLFKEGTSSSKVCGVILPNPVRGLETKIGVIYNGDEDENTLVNASNINAPTISFQCLARFFRTGFVEPVLKMLANGEIEVVDFVASDFRALTRDEEKAVRAFRAYQLAQRDRKKLDKKFDKHPPVLPKPPASGYVLVSDEKWHRTSTVLLHAKKQDFTILMGVDEDAYFGCQLADNPTTVNDAYTSLIPPELRDDPALLRQGEWFLATIMEKDVPPVNQCIALFSSIVLPVETIESHGHWVLTEQYNGVDSQDEQNLPTSGRVGPDGVIYAKYPTLRHPDHDDLDIRFGGWVRFYKSTAVRSFSEEGVD